MRHVQVERPASPIRLIRAIASACLIAGLVACGSASSTPAPTRIALPPGRVALPDHEPCRAPDGIACVETGHAVFGLLHEADGCIWYVLDNDAEVRIVWPFGYSATFDPFVVYDNAGREVARAGASLAAAGTGPLHGEPDACGRASYVVFADPVVERPEDQG